MRKLPTIRMVFDRKHTATKTVRGLVQAEVLYERKRKWVSTGVKVYSDQWDDRKWVVNSLDSVRLNRLLSDLKQRMEGYFDSCDVFSWEAFSLWLERGRENERKETFIDFCERRISKRTDISDHTRRMQKRLPKSLREFGRIVLFSDLTRANVQAYHEWLRGKYDNEYSIYDYIKYLRTYVNEALKLDLIDKYPFAGMKFKRGEPRADRFLTEDEVRKIAGARMPTMGMERVRDLFVIQCYTGLSFSDLMTVDFRKAVRRGDNFVLTGERTKTRESYYVVLMRPVVEILERYGWRVPTMTNQQYNLRLKVAVEAAGIDKKVTSHYGRRTCGYLLLNNGFPIEQVARVLGHANIATTQKVYAKILNTTLDKSFSELERKITENPDAEGTGDEKGESGT